MDDEFEGFLETVTPLLRDRRRDELRELLAEQDAADIAQLLERGFPGQRLANTLKCWSKEASEVTWPC